MLTQVAEGVQVHVSGFCRSNAVAVRGRGGVLLVDPGVREDELACLADDLAASGREVVAGFATHPHWDHLLWHPRLGTPPRYATARAAAVVRDRLSGPDARTRVAAVLPPDLADRIPLDLLGEVTGLPEDAARIPWDGPEVRIVEHRAHAPGHAALLVEDRGVLIAGDLLSDVLVPMLDPAAADPVGDHLAALELLESLAAEVLVPGHGSVTRDVRGRIELDRAYLHAVRDGRTPDDPRIGPAAETGWEWVAGVHERQLASLAG